MAKSTLRAAATRAELDAAFETELATRRAELAAIEADTAAFLKKIGARKIKARDAIIALEREHATHADRLRDPNAGPDQGIGLPDAS